MHARGYPHPPRTAAPPHTAEPACRCCQPNADTFGPDVPAAPAVVALTVCLYAFCIVFAVNSAIHSYLIVAYAEGDKVCQLHSAPYFPCCEAT